MPFLLFSNFPRRALTVILGTPVGTGVVVGTSVVTATGGRAAILPLGVLGEIDAVVDTKL